MTDHPRPPRRPRDVDAAHLDRPRAERVRAVAALASRPARRRTGTFLVEGPQGCREALRAHLGEGPEAARGLWRPGRVLTQVFVSADLAERDPELAGLIARLTDVPVRTATAEVLTAMSAAVTGQGVLAVARIPEALREAAAAGDAGPAAPAVPEGTGPWAGVRLAAVLCRVQDPGNAGTILRAADAAGADLVVLTPGSVDPFNPKVVRSTAGSLFHLRLAVGVPAARAAEGARAAGLQVWAAHGYADDRLDLLRPATLAAPTAWLLGNEAQGLDDAERACADRAVAVPLYGAAESLNVGTAATVCLYASAMAARGGGT